MFGLSVELVLLRRTPNANKNHKRCTMKTKKTFGLLFSPLISPPVKLNLHVIALASRRTFRLPWIAFLKSAITVK